MADIADACKCDVNETTSIVLTKMPRLDDSKTKGMCQVHDFDARITAPLQPYLHNLGQILFLVRLMESEPSELGLRVVAASAQTIHFTNLRKNGLNCLI